MALFKDYTQTRKQLFWTMITSFGLQSNEHSLGLISNTLTPNDLFVEV